MRGAKRRLGSLERASDHRGARVIDGSRIGVCAIGVGASAKTINTAARAACTGSHEFENLARVLSRGPLLQCSLGLLTVIIAVQQIQALVQFGGGSLTLKLGRQRAGCQRRRDHCLGRRPCSRSRGCNNSYLLFRRG